MSLRVGVIGLGFFGTRHARIYAEHPAAELVAVCDSDAGRLDAFTVPDVQRFTDFEAMLALPGLDAVSICLPDRLHEKAAIAAAKAGKASILFYMGVHDVDALQWCARSRITRVYAQKRQVLGHGNEDALQAVLNFENGAIGLLDYSWAWPDGLMNGFRSSLEIVGTLSALRVDCADQGFFTIDDQGTAGSDTHLWPEINGRITGNLADELDHFIKATRDRRPYLQHYAEAFDAIPVLDALALSAEKGVAIDVAR